MQLVTIGPKYQVVIPKEVRMQIKGIKPGAKVMIKRADNNTVTVKTNKLSWSDESYGFMKDAWKDIDPATEIEKMRNEWDAKLK